MITLLHGDCLDLMDTIGDGSIDLILADLPYGTTACKWDTVIPLEPLWTQYKRIIKRNGAIVLTASQPFTTTLISSNREWFRYCWYWQKERGTGFASSAYQPLRQVEDVCVFYRQQPTYNPQLKQLERPYRHVLPVYKADVMRGPVLSMTADGGRVYKEYTHAQPTTLLEVARDNVRAGLHPTQKPVALMEYLIRTYTNESETVLDNTMGSGTTGVACINTNRSFIGIEKDAGYFQIAQQRIQKAQEAHQPTLFDLTA